MQLFTILIRVRRTFLHTLTTPVYLLRCLKNLCAQIHMQVHFEKKFPFTYYIFMPPSSSGKHRQPQLSTTTTMPVDLNLFSLNNNCLCSASTLWMLPLILFRALVLHRLYWQKIKRLWFLVLLAANDVKRNKIVVSLRVDSPQIKMTIVLCKNSVQFHTLHCITENHFSKLFRVKVCFV